MKGYCFKEFYCVRRLQSIKIVAKPELMLWNIAYIIFEERFIEQKMLHIFYGQSRIYKSEIVSNKTII